MRTRRVHRGTILIVSLAILAILALIGATMIKVARVDNLAARNFKHGIDLDLAIEGSLEWLEFKRVDYYYDKLENDAWGAYDNPHEEACMLALVSPHYNTGRITGTTDVTTGGLYVTSDHHYYDASYETMVANGERWFNLPMTPSMPVPGRKGPINGSLPTGGILKDELGGIDRLTMITSDNRRIEVSLTVVDLCARFNVNFHGDADFDGKTNSGQSYNDDGAYLSQVAPNWNDIGGSDHTHSVIAMGDDWGSLISAGKRWGDDRKAEFDDQQMNFFDFTNKSNAKVTTGTRASTPYYDDLPFLLEDLYELLYLNGTKGKTRLERLLPMSIPRTGEETPDKRVYRKAQLTTHSWVSSVRKRFDSIESMAVLCPKADLNNFPMPEETNPTSTTELKKNPLRRALLGSGAWTSYPTEEADQVFLNILDFKDEDCRPSYIELTNYTVIGVDAQPFINEVFIDIQHKRSVTENGVNYDIYPVYVELANPYKKALPRSEAFSKLTYGDSRTSISLSATEWATIETGGPLSGQTTGEVADFTVKVTAGTPELQVRTKVFPIELFAMARSLSGTSGGDKEVLIDRFKDSSALEVGKSDQRLSVRGKDRNGVEHIYFGGYDSRSAKRAQTCVGTLTSGGTGPRFEMNPADPSWRDKIARPIENRSLTPKWTSQDRGRYTAEKMSFRRVGDIARILRKGHILSTSPSSASTITEQLGGIGDDAQVRTLYVDITDAKYRKLTNVLAVGSMYFDNKDNDGDTYIDEKDAAYTGDDSTPGTQDDDNLGPEIYQFAPINLKTAQPAVIRGLLSAQLKNPAISRTFSASDTYLWNLAVEICKQAQDRANNGSTPIIKCPADVLDVVLNGKVVKDMFINDGCDDDDNGAVDDWAERTWLYGFMSNWATTRTDCLAVYGTVRMVNNDGRTEGVRHFVAVVDTVPATAYQPFLKKGTAAAPADVNTRYLGMRLVHRSWLD